MPQRARVIRRSNEGPKGESGPTVSAGILGSASMSRRRSREALRLGYRTTFQDPGRLLL